VPKKYSRVPKLKELKIVTVSPACLDKSAVFILFVVLAYWDLVSLWYWWFIGMNFGWWVLNNFKPS
jgi:hypothetical protein